MLRKRNFAFVLTKKRPAKELFFYVIFINSEHELQPEALLLHP
jgi:hypothetical protein